MGARRSCPVLVGRARESTELEETLELARQGRSTTILIGGEAGVGKSRLVNELADRARQSQARVVVGGCLEIGGGNLPFSAVVEALRGLVDLVGVEPLRRAAGDGARELRRLVPGIGAPVPSEPALDAPAERSAQVRLFESLLRLLERLGRDHPLVFVLEDVHWADPSTRELLVFLAHNLRDASVLLVATYRDDELHRTHPLRPVISELVRSDRVRRLQLERLGSEALSELLQGILGTPPERDLLQRVLERSRGNPFFVEELIAAGLEEGAPLPPNLRDILLTTLSSLPLGTQRALGAAAAAGGRIHHALLARLDDLDSAGDEALRTAVDRGLLVPDATSGTYAFRHALLAEAVLSTLLPGERTGLHRRIAQALEAHPSLAVGAPAGELAHHWYSAGDQPRSLVASLDAAREAEALHAVVEARGHVERMLQLWDVVDDAAERTGQDRATLLAWAAELTYLSGDPVRAVSILEQVLAETDHQAAQRQNGHRYERLGHYRRAAGDVGGARRAFARAVELVPPSPPSPERAQVLTSYAAELAHQFEHHEAKDHGEEAIRIARQVGDRAIEGRALASLGITLAGLGHLEEATSRVGDALSIAEERSSPEDVVRAHSVMSMILIRGGRLDEGAVASLTGLERSRQLGVDRLHGPHLAGNATSALFHAGRWDEAADLLSEVVGGSAGVGWLRLLQARLLAHRGEFDAARRTLTEATTFRIEEEPRYPNVVLSLSVLEGDHDLARRHILARHAAAAPAHAGTVNEFRAWALRAEADRLDSGRAAETAAARNLADELLSEVTDQHGRGIAHAGAWRLTAQAEHRRLDGRPSAGYWETALAAWDDIGWVYQAAYCRYRLAAALLTTDRAKASEHLERAYGVATGLRAVPLAASISTLARDARIALPGTARSDPGDRGLTPREIEVLAHLVEHRTNREIGEALYITEKTASVHVSNITKKLGVSDRHGAAEQAHRLGLADAADPRH